MRIKSHLILFTAIEVYFTEGFDKRAGRKVCNTSNALPNIFLRVTLTSNMQKMLRVSIRTVAYEAGGHGPLICFKGSNASQNFGQFHVFQAFLLSIYILCNQCWLFYFYSLINLFIN